MKVRPCIVCVKIGEEMESNGHQVDRLDLIMNGLRVRIVATETETAEMENGHTVSRGRMAIRPYDTASMIRFTACDLFRM
jgi:hypothetical protein